MSVTGTALLVTIPAITILWVWLQVFNKNSIKARLVWFILVRVPPARNAIITFCSRLVNWYQHFWRLNTVKPVYNGPVYSGHLVSYGYVPDNFPKSWVALYFLQSWPVFSGHPVYNGHLAISQGWPLYTAGLTVSSLSKNVVDKVLESISECIEEDKWTYFLIVPMCKHESEIWFSRWFISFLGL